MATVMKKPATLMKKPATVMKKPHAHEEASGARETPHAARMRAHRKKCEDDKKKEQNAARRKRVKKKEQNAATRARNAASASKPCPQMRDTKLNRIAADAWEAKLLAVHGEIKAGQALEQGRRNDESIQQTREELASVEIGAKRALRISMHNRLRLDAMDQAKGFKTPPRVSPRGSFDEC